jgi:6-phosphogluconolactonase
MNCLGQIQCGKDNSMSSVIEVLADKAGVVQRSLALVLEELHGAIASRGQFTIALAGGSTPKPLYEAIATQDLPWDKIHVFWGDERYVPPDHPDSNEGMTRKAWLSHVPIPEANIHRIPTEPNDPIVAAEEYDRHIREFFQTPPGEFPSLDMILLGMGDDAHTASLFPYTPALQVCDRLITVGHKDGQPRITFTVPLINSARCVVFLVTGTNKQAALAQVFASEADYNHYPSRLIRPQGKLIWLLDVDAAAGLPA